MPAPIKQNNVNYVVIRDSSLCFQSKEHKPGYEPYSDKFIQRLDHVEGRIAKIDYYSKEWEGRKLQGYNVRVDDGENIYSVDFSFNSTEGSRFMKVAANIDYAQWVKIKVWHDRKRNKVAIAFYQDDQNVEEYFKHNQYDDNQQLVREGNLPDPDVTWRDESPIYNWAKVEDILFRFLRDKVIPYVDNANAEFIRNNHDDQHQSEAPEQPKPQPVHVEQMPASAATPYGPQSVVVSGPSPATMAGRMPSNAPNQAASPQPVAPRSTKPVSPPPPPLERPMPDEWTQGKPATVAEMHRMKQQMDQTERGDPNGQTFGNPPSNKDDDIPF